MIFRISFILLSLMTICMLLLAGCEQIKDTASEETKAQDSADSQEKPAETEITKLELYIGCHWPDLQDDIDYTENPMHITGVVSDPDASVVVYVVMGNPSNVPTNTVKATINGFNFEADVFLKPGHISVVAMAEREGQSALSYITIDVDKNGSAAYTPAPVFPGQPSIQVWNETTEPALTIDYRWPDLQDGIDYTKKPVHISGKVSDPEASVVVYVTAGDSSGVTPDTVEATVNGFDFRADVFLKPGHISVVALAERKGQTARRQITVDVTEDGSVIYTSGKSDGSTLPTHSWAELNLQSSSLINIKAGETRIYNIGLVTNDGFPSDALPAECGFRTWRSPGTNPDSKMPLPEGMTISIEPPSFLAYMYMKYDFTMRIETNADLATGLYFIHLQIVPPNLPDYDERSGLIVIIVEGS